MEQDALDQGRQFRESEAEVVAAAAEYWIPARAGMTAEYDDEVGGYGERMSHISSNML